MYNGKNPSALKSMEYLRQAMLKMLETEKYDRITVKQLCLKADLSRQTFYQTFHSKDEVVQYHFSILFSEFAKECNSFRDIDVSYIVYHFFDFFYVHRNFIEVLIKNNLTYLLEEQFEVYLNKIDLFTRVNDKAAYPDYTTAFIAGALTQVLVHWFENSFIPNINELSLLTEKNLSDGHFE